jgi:hypothetical protein
VNESSRIDGGALLPRGGTIVEAATISTATSNQQVAPSILVLLGIDPFELEAVRREQTLILPIPVPSIPERD